MSSLDIRSNSAVMKRAEQLKRWEESDTNREPPTPRPEKGRRIKFSSGCVFLAACLAGDKEEVLKLLENGADINTANVDGLTALHQACIDDNLEMVEFLVENGADINRQDNEGWTPLHATASCGFVSIARFLVEHDADVSAVNSDGDLAVDLAVDSHHLPMIEFMQKMVNKYNIDCEKARQAEEQLMLNDAKKWLRSDASEIDRPHPKTGATALHVAAAKGYTKVLSLLLAGRANVDKQDNDGWTPLHAAAHWGQKEAAEMLVDAMADMEVRNYGGQTCTDVAERKMLKFLEELRTNNRHMNRRPSSQIRISDTIENHMDNSSAKLIHVEVKPDQSKESLSGEKLNTPTANPSANVEEEAPWRRISLASRNRLQNDNLIKNQSPDSKTNTTTTSTGAHSSSTCNNTSSSAIVSADNVKESSDVILRRTPQSAESEEVKLETPPTSLNTASKLDASTTAAPVRRSFAPPVRDEESETQRKLHAKRVRETRRSTQGVTLDEIKSAEELVKKKNSSMGLNNNNSINSNISSGVKSDDVSGKIYPSNNSIIIPSAPAVIAAANLSSTVGQRRISSGGTTSSIYSSNQSLNSVSGVRPASASGIIGSNASSGATSSSGDTSSIRDRLSADNTSNTFTVHRSSTASGVSSLTLTPTSVSSLVVSQPADTSTKRNDLNDNDKENDNRSSLATQAVIQRRRKPKRRSTGVVHLDIDDLEGERQESSNDNDEKNSETPASASDRSSRSCSGSTANTSISTTAMDNKSNDSSGNSDSIDYKALWETVKLENQKLKDQLKIKDDEVIQARTTVEKVTSAMSKNSLSEIEKRERRAMERKFSEMEEELKQLEVYKMENQRLKEENGALIRVISKLSK